MDVLLQPDRLHVCAQRLAVGSVGITHKDKHWCGGAMPSHHSCLCVRKGEHSLEPIDTPNVDEDVAWAFRLERGNRNRCWNHAHPRSLPPTVDHRIPQYVGGRDERIDRIEHASTPMVGDGEGVRCTDQTRVANTPVSHAPPRELPNASSARNAVAHEVSARTDHPEVRESHDNRDILVVQGSKHGGRHLAQILEHKSNVGLRIHDEPRQRTSNLTGIERPPESTAQGPGRPSVIAEVDLIVACNRWNEVRGPVVVHIAPIGH